MMDYIKKGVKTKNPLLCILLTLRDTKNNNELYIDYASKKSLTLILHCFKIDVNVPSLISLWCGKL